MSSFLRVIRIVLLISIFFCLGACTQLENDLQQPPEAIQGVLDLQDWDFEKDGSINLRGGWAFYWEELFLPEEIKNQTLKSYVSVPDIWTNYDIEGKTITPEGFATYHLLIYPPDAHQTFGLYIEGQGSAYKLWVDGHLVSQNGEIGTSLQSMRPEKKPYTIFFEPDGEAVELVMQISNFHHRKGGFRNNLLLGIAETMHQTQMQNWFIEAFAVGVLFIMGLYHFFLYTFRKKNKAPLYFALITWLMTIRVGITNQNTLLFHLPALSWDLALRIEYLTFFLGPLAFSLFIQSLYPKDIHRWFIRAMFWLGCSFSLLVFFTDTLRLSYIPPYYQVVFLLGIIYYLFFLQRIIAKNRDGAVYIAIASLVSFVAIIIETLSLNNLLPYGRVTSFSFLAYILAQAVLLSARFSRSFDRVETLSTDLEKANISLQQSEKKYRNIFEDSKDIIFIASIDTKIEDISPACEEILGYSRNELREIRIVDVMDNPELQSQFEKKISNQGIVRNFEVVLQRKDGKKIDALVSATLRRDEDDKVIGVQGNVRDITDRKQAEFERLRALKFQEISITDPLTQIYNRRHFYETAEKELERAKRTKSPLALVILDIDHFKAVNDTHGHLAGDQVLIELVDLCKEKIRNIDTFARFGGEEFIILMPETDSTSAQETAQRLCELVTEKPIAISDELNLPITISLGVASWDAEKNVDINTLLNRADHALYQSKENGRNQATIWRAD